MGHSDEMRKLYVWYITYTRTIQAYNRREDALLSLIGEIAIVEEVLPIRIPQVSYKYGLALASTALARKLCRPHRPIISFQL